ncbi:hypothetical protein OS493_020681 [Desmophyllum pertusum]|uniref:Uncharacterized protein n=1 Tax=Desmophyllum pertusum TaxID=174260 RepID=A0A9X0CM07_9CNID|nr:hypothetical protein OS493_020681 [Desmophyllum pertusum]
MLKNVKASHLRSNSQKTYSVDERRGEISATHEDSQKEFPMAAGGFDLAGERNGVADSEIKEIEPQQPTKIQVTLPSIDDPHEDSSIASEPPVSIEQDTFGDVSSISGGDF